MKRKEVKVHCKTCNKEIIRCPSTVQTNNFCNKECYNEEKRKNWTSGKNPRWTGGEKKLVCLICHRDFQSKGYGERKTKFCSHKCYSQYRGDTFRGTNHPNWKNAGGVITKPVRSQKAYKDWRKYVLERDGNRCVDCGASEQLHTHHINGLADIVLDITEKYGEIRYTDERLFDVNNGMTLCAICHRRLHKKTGRIAGTPHKVV